MMTNLLASTRILSCLLFLFDVCHGTDIPGKVEASFNMVDANDRVATAVKKYAKGGADAVDQVPCVNGETGYYIFCGEISSNGKKRLSTLNATPNFQGRTDKIKDSVSTSAIVAALNECSERKTGDRVLANYEFGGKSKTSLVMDGKYKGKQFYCGMRVWIE